MDSYTFKGHVGFLRGKIQINPGTRVEYHATLGGSVSIESGGVSFFTTQSDLARKINADALVGQKSDF